MKYEHINQDSVSATYTQALPAFSMNQANSFALQYDVTVSTPSAKTFDSKAKASKVIQDLTYTAVAYGVAGNSITLTYVNDGTAGAETVDVTGNAITVHMDDTPVTGSSADNIKAAVQASGPASALVDVSGSAATVQTAQASTALENGVDTEIDLTANTMSIPTHGMLTGLKVQASTTDTLPTGLSTSTDYYVIKVDANTIKLATSLVNAQAGTAIDLTGEGVGVHTITATALAGCSIKAQESVDGQNFYDISGITANITATGKALLQGTSKCGQVRTYLTMTAGQLDIIVKVNTKE